jgi:hypothetical protein
MPQIKFNLKQLNDLTGDVKGARKSLPLIISKSLRLDLMAARRQLAGQIPSVKGKVRKSLYWWIKKQPGGVRARFGFRTKGLDAQTAIAANVLMSGATIVPKNAKSLWVPIGSNVNAAGDAVMSPRDLWAAGNFFLDGNLVLKKTPGGGVEPVFALKKLITLSPRRIEEPAAVVERRLPEIAGNIETLIARALVAKRNALDALGAAGG